ncbi:MAG: hypothetical protein ACKVT1_18485 [Dehalococcoidia bacterium]
MDRVDGRVAVGAAAPAGQRGHRVAGDEAAGGGVVVARPQVLQARAGVALLPREAELNSLALLDKASIAAGGLIGRELRIAFRRVPAAAIPEGREALTAWLLDQWAVLDRWVGANEGAPTT